MLHGTYSKSSVKDRYTEFRLEDLNSKLYHYWALGHIHERQQLSDLPVINYAGNIQGRHFNEKVKKAVYLSKDNLKLTTQFYPTQSIKFEEATIETSETTKQGLYEAIQAFKDKVREEGKAFYRLNVIINSESMMSPQDILQVEEMITDYEENEKILYL